MKDQLSSVIRLVASTSLLASISCGTPEAPPATEPGGQPARDIELLNVSYDPTREVWRDINNQFDTLWETEHGGTIEIKQSHGGSSTQARAVIDGLEADVVTLASFVDTDAIADRGLIRPDWQSQDYAAPYYSTVVFVVRKGNPKGIADWPDLAKPGVQVITPNPKTSGNGYISFFAAWGSVVLRGGTREQAIEYMTKLYRNVPVLDSGARGATTTFVQKKIGDVHLAWENEAHLEVREAGGELELVYPPISIRAEPYVAVVDGNVDRKGTREAAEAYLRYTMTDRAQETFARHFYRPANEAVLQKHASTFPDLQLFPVTEIAAGWVEAQREFTGEGSVFDSIYKPESGK